MDDCHYLTTTSYGPDTRLPTVVSLELSASETGFRFAGDHGCKCGSCSSESTPRRVNTQPERLRGARLESPQALKGSVPSHAFKLRGTRQAVS